MGDAKRFDIVVIGTGPSGEGAAMMAAKSHKAVAAVERYEEVGGGCTHWGTIPSKALRQAVKVLHDARTNPLLGDHCRDLQPGFAQLLRSADGVIDKQVAQRRRYYERNKVPVLQGDARFVGPNELEVNKPNSAPVRVQAEHFVIATGSRPYHPPEIDFAHPRIRDSDTVLKYSDTPFSITIFGAGVIGCEYASIFVNLGCKVTLVNTQDRLLSFLDEEIAEALSYHLREQGCIIRHNEQFAGVEARERDVVLSLKSARKVKSDVLLWTNGRTGNSDSLALDRVGLKANSRGHLKVNEAFQTEVKHVYAVGDIIGPPALASIAYDQGRYAVDHILTGKTDPLRAELMPTGIYTLPEISSVGRTERELQEAKVAYEVGNASFKNLARAQMTGETVGMLKLLFDAKSLQILGVHCFGDRASEIVHIGQTVMANPALNNLKYFINTTFNYPTMAEAYRVAAHNGLNRLA
jgi:NAD(P) transhydrogenase